MFFYPVTNLFLNPISQLTWLGQSISCWLLVPTLSTVFFLFTFALDWQQCIWPGRSIWTLRGRHARSSRAAHPAPPPSSGGWEFAGKIVYIHAVNIVKAVTAVIHAVTAIIHAVTAALVVESQLEKQLTFVVNIVKTVTAVIHAVTAVIHAVTYHNYSGSWWLRVCWKNSLLLWSILWE